MQCEYYGVAPASSNLTTRGLCPNNASNLKCGIRVKDAWCDLQGKAELPFPKGDFWAEANLSQRAAWTKHTDSNQNHLRIFDAPGIDVMPDSPLIFFSCKAGQCDGGTNFSCAEGYTGTMCSECKPGQFFFQGKCSISCDSIEPKGVVTVFGILAVVCVWLIVNFIPSK